MADKFPGLLEEGNIDLTKRPIVKNVDGSISTVRSMGVNIDNQEVLIPTVSDDGRVMSDQEAIDVYKKTGKHLGKFKSPDASSVYAEKLHLDQEKMYMDKTSGEAKPPIMPWEENYELKPTQAPAAPTLIQRAQEGVSQVVEAVKNVKMPWEMSWTEKPRPTLARPVQADVRKNEPASVDGFLSKMETVESGGVADAKNPTSTATGLHQFTAGTWRDTVAEMGKDYTLADRKDPVKSREVARFFTQQNAKQAESELGRKPTEVDLYMYHFLGRGAAGEFLKAPRDEEATKYVSSKAARDNAAVFYSKGKPRTVGEVIDNFRRRF